MNRRNMPTVAELNSSAVIPRQRLIPDVRQILQSPDHSNLVQDVVDRGTSPINFDAPRRDRGTSPLTVRHVVGLLEAVQRNVPELRRFTRLALRETRKRPRRQQQNGEGSSSSNVAPREIDDERNNLLNNTEERLMIKRRRERFENFRQRMRLDMLRSEYKKTYGEVPIPDHNTSLKDHIDNLEREWEREREEAAAAPPRDVPVENRLE
ncbi:hypothetical protein CRE_24126 [Caenorhabditis remanei]|uniref:Uncharacterized protein n=1 Tax=Caenorhabditis remanei TaxID=31234 RepID=E3N427_CAERE|nr:hypothetical protein CRE_24126 [Caenorhabditis remanei]